MGVYKNALLREKKKHVVATFQFWSTKVTNWQFTNFKNRSKKLKIGNQFLVFLPFSGHTFQNSDTMGIYETQFLEAF